ncbi:MAG: universal stress protein [Verrucomicrobiota bacterium]|nr:universal stress protein [Verrucomicrobiota bacterium]
MKTKSVTKRRSPAGKVRSSAKASSRPASAGATKTRPRSRLKVETILVPIDFSAGSLFAIQWAKFLAQRTKANIHLVNVHDFGYPVARALTPPVIGSETEIKEHLHRDLQVLALSQKLPHASLQIRVGRPHSQICELASEIQADLIVLSTHGRTGWERALLGSTAERVIRHAPCPVLVARPTSRKKTELKLQKILVPLDFSACAARGLHYAIDLAKVFKAKLTLINVSQLHHDLPPVVIYSDAALNRWAAEVAEAHMADLVKETDFEGVEFETVHKNGSPARKICRYAVKEGADLIVSSTHGRTGISHALIGSTAEKISRYARSPVLIVPSHGRGSAAK